MHEHKAGNAIVASYRCLGLGEGPDDSLAVRVTEERWRGRPERGANGGPSQEVALERIDVPNLDEAVGRSHRNVLVGRPDGDDLVSGMAQRVEGSGSVDQGSQWKERRRRSGGGRSAGRDVLRSLMFSIEASVAPVQS
jgi:hypothetical protein